MLYKFTDALQKYDQIDAFSEGLAAVRRDGKWGYINLKGEEVIPCQFPDTNKVGQFSEGVACVVDNRNKADSALWNKRVGFINKTGEWVLVGDFFTEAQFPYAPLADYADYLPSFKDGKVAVWDKPSTYDKWDEWDRDSKIILVDHKGKTYEVADSIGKELSAYRPYPNKSNSEPNRIQAYDDYFISEYRDTLQCDNGARLVTWSVMDTNNLPYDTKDKTIQYFIDNYGNSTLTPDQSQVMERHINDVLESLRTQHNQQLVAERQRQEEEERQRQESERQIRYESQDSDLSSWLNGTWETTHGGGAATFGYRLVISGNHMKFYKNGVLDDSGTFTISGNTINAPGGRTMRIDKSNNCIDYYITSFRKVGGSFSGQFRTVADVWAYLSSHTFTGNGTTFRISERYIIINGTPATGGVRVSNIRATSATLSASSPYLGGHQIILYLNAANGTIISDGLTYYAH